MSGLSAAMGAAAAAAVGSAARLIRLVASPLLIVGVFESSCSAPRLKGAFPLPADAWRVSVGIVIRCREMELCRDWLELLDVLTWVERYGPESSEGTDCEVGIFAGRVVVVVVVVELVRGRGSCSL